MRENLIPLLWDNGKVAGLAAVAQGMLRLCPPFDEAPAREIVQHTGQQRDAASSVRNHRQNHRSVIR